jgi:hypothetical protein
VFDGSPSELKQKARKVESILIRGGPFHDALVKELSSVGMITPVNGGASLRITTDTPYSTIRQVLDILEKKNVQAFIAMEEPSLEDAFAELVGEGEDS